MFRFANPEYLYLLLIVPILWGIYLYGRYRSKKNIHKFGRADVLVPLTPVIVAQMKKGAYYITSGILDVKEDVVVQAVKDAGLTLVEVTHQGEWVSVTARKD